MPLDPSASTGIVAPDHVASLNAAVTGEVFAPLPRQRLEAAAIAHAETPWLGIGLCGAAPGRALPVDVLVMIAALETVRRAIGADRGRVLIADSNAWAEGLAPASVEPLARHIEDTLAAVARTLRFPLELVRGSAIAPWSARACASRSPDLPPYAHEQLAQMHAMAISGATVKVGWRLAGHGFDEAYFDDAYVGLHSRAPMSFVYTIPGRGLDPRRPRACPYVAPRPDERICLAAGERVSDKLAAAQDDAPREVAGYRRLLAKIARTLAKLQGRRPSRRPEHDLQEIIDRCGRTPPAAVV